MIAMADHATYVIADRAVGCRANGCLNARATLQANDALRPNSGPIPMLKEAVKMARTRACSELSLSRRSCEQEALGAHCLVQVRAALLKPRTR